MARVITGRSQVDVDERTAREARERVNAEKEQYLRSTDWLVIREAERFLRRQMINLGEKVPEVFDERESAREAVARDEPREERR